MSVWSHIHVQHHLYYTDGTPEQIPMFIYSTYNKMHISSIRRSSFKLYIFTRGPFAGSSHTFWGGYGVRSQLRIRFEGGSRQIGFTDTFLPQNLIGQGGLRGSAPTTSYTRKTPFAKHLQHHFGGLEWKPAILAILLVDLWRLFTTWLSFYTRKPRLQSICRLILGVWSGSLVILDTGARSLTSPKKTKTELNFR